MIESSPNSPLLPASFYRLSALEASPLLLGQTLVRVTEDGEIRCRIVETESYGGIEDKGSHAYGNRRTARTEPLFMEGGVSYVYLIYGMYHLFNVVVGPKDNPQAILVRAVEPLTPQDEALMLRYRGHLSGKLVHLSNGPGKLCRALRIDKSLNKCTLNVRSGPLWLEAGDPAEQLSIVQGPRINIDYAEEYADKPWRFYIKDHPYVSVRDKQEQPFTFS